MELTLEIYKQLRLDSDHNTPCCFPTPNFRLEKGATQGSGPRLGTSWLAARGWALLGSSPASTSHCTWARPLLRGHLSPRRACAVGAASLPEGSVSQVINWVHDRYVTKAR